MASYLGHCVESIIHKSGAAFASSFYQHFIYFFFQVECFPTNSNFCTGDRVFSLIYFFFAGGGVALLYVLYISFNIVSISQVTYLYTSGAAKLIFITFFLRSGW